MSEFEKTDLYFQEKVELLGKENFANALEFEYQSLSQQEKDDDWSKIQQSVQTKVEAKDFAFAAGPGTTLTSIQGEAIGIPSICIHFDKVQQGYKVNISSDIPMKLKMIFMKNAQVLYESFITNEVADSAVKDSDIEGWTHIHFTR